MAVATAEARTMVMVAMVMVTFALVALAITRFVTRNVVAIAITGVVAVDITFVSMQQRGLCKDNKSNGDCNKEGSGDSGKSNGDGV